MTSEQRYDLEFANSERRLQQIFQEITSSYMRGFLEDCLFVGTSKDWAWVAEKGTMLHG